MSQEMFVMSTIDIPCPHCDEYNELYDIAFSLTIESVDTVRPVREAAFTHECEECGLEFEINPEANIEVRKP